MSPVVSFEHFINRPKANVRFRAVSGREYAHGAKAVALWLIAARNKPEKFNKSFFNNFNVYEIRY